MTVPNTKENRAIQEVVATLAIENMYVNKTFIHEIMKVSKGEKTYDQLIQEVISKHAR